MDSTIQILMIIAYLIVTIAVGAVSRKSAQNSKVFMGAYLGTLLCVASGAGEWMGGTSTTGVAEYGYVYGISGAWYTIANGLGIIFLSVCFARLYRSLEKVTVAGIIGRYLGKEARVVSAGLLIIVMIVVGASQMAAAGTLGQMLLGLNATWSIVIIGGGIILYTLFGGMMAVGYTNVMHVLTMYFGIIVVLVLSLGEVGGMGKLVSSLPESYVSFTAIGHNKIISWIIASVLGACTAQAGIQPILAAKDEKTAVRSSFLIAVLVAPFGILTALLGMIAKVRLPELSNAKLALPSLIISLNPIAGGLVTAAILAAILSTASPIFLAAGTLYTRDIYQYFRKEADEKSVYRISRVSTGLSGLVCMLLAIMLYNSARLLDIVYFAYSIRGSIFVILLLGIYWKRTTSRGAIAGMLFTAVTGIVWVSWKGITGTYPFHPGFTETYASVTVAFLVTVLFSVIQKGTDTK